MDKLEPEYATDYANWKTSPTPQTTGALLRRVDPVLKFAVQQYGGSSSPTLKSQAKQLAIDAFGTYDPQKGHLRTHLMGHLQRLHRLAGQEQQIIRLPERVSLDRTRVSQATADLSDQLGREPSDRELADYTGLSMRRLAYINQAQRPVAEGTLMRPTDGEEGGYAPAVTQPGTNRQSAWLDFVYDDLTPTDQFIMERMLGMHGRRKMTIMDIAKQLKVTPGAVSQRLKRIQQKLDKIQDLGVQL